MDPFFSPNAPDPQAACCSVGHAKSNLLSRKNVQWNSFENKIFIAACEIVIAEGHRNGKCLIKHDRETLIHLFNSISDHNWNKMQLKNRWDALRVKHKRLEELLRCTGVEYNPCTGRIIASDESWVRKIKENKDYRNFKDRDCREVYSYKALFGDAFDSDRYSITPSKLCRIDFAMFEDSGLEDHRDEVPLDDEGIGSSDEGFATGMASAAMDLSGPRSGNKRRAVN